MGRSQSGQVGAGTEGVLRAAPPQRRPQVRTCEVRGRNSSPQTTHARCSTCAGAGSLIKYRRGTPAVTTLRPSASMCMAISGSAEVNCAASVVPSPSQTPRVYGGSASARSGRSSGAALATLWFARRPPVSQRTVRAISSVVRTSARSAPDLLERREARVCVSHWCCSSATMTVPSENVTSKQGRSNMTSVAATTRVGRPSPSSSRSPTATSPIVTQPVGVGSGVSRASAFPIAGLPARTISWPPCRPLVRESRSANPVGTPTIAPPREEIASISSRVPCMISDSGR